MASVRIVSVPHTGTIFTRYLVEAFGLSAAALHVSNEGDDRWRAKGTRVVPLRDPILSCITRANRIMTDMRFVPDAAGGIDGVDFPTWIGFFNRLVEIEGDDVHYVHVAGKKDEEIAKLSQFLGRTLGEYNWSPLNIRADKLQLKQHWQSGNVDAIQAVLPGCIDALRDSPDVISLYERHGVPLKFVESQHE